MLRLKPIASLADGAKPPVGVGTTYTLPTASSPNGPNLFDGTEGGGGKTKPEIYAMGLRNPSRLAIDPKTDVPYAAWVGPDAGVPSASQGPSTYENATQLPTAGNYGWPYCMGNQQAYRDRVADGSLRTTNGPGFVNGGPAAQPDARLVRLQEPRQRLDQQHRSDHPAAHHGHGQGRRHGSLAQHLVQPRQPERRPTAARSSRARTPTRRRTTARSRRSCART